MCPSTLVFVVKELVPERWINGGSSHFTVVLKQPDGKAIANKVSVSVGSGVLLTPLGG